jgi:DNA-binding GntR family transcriptional regulator
MNKVSKTQELESLKTNYKSIADVTCEKLRKAIVEGVFSPGEQLKERELATLMGVSTTPIKAALQRLAMEGLVTSLPMRGSFVAENISAILTEVGLIRAALEGTAAYLAAVKATDEEINTLQVQIEKMERCTRERDIDRAIEANTSFHEIIHQISGNHSLQQMTGIVRQYDDITRPRALADEAQMVQGLAEHKAIFEAIKAQDSEGADASMRAHVLRNTRFLEHQGLGVEKD